MAALRQVALLLLVLAAARHAAALSCTGLPQTTPLNANTWPASCSGLSGSSVCSTSCRAGYGSSQTPFSICNGVTGAWGTPVGSCDQVCTTVPPAAALPGGQWPASCANTIAVRGRCLGVCDSGLVGSPSIQCTANGWETSLIVGQCAPPPACQGLPPILRNQLNWPQSCAGAVSGSVCQGVCNSNYRALPPPRSTCLSNSSWSTPTPGTCQLGSGGVWPSPSPVVPSPSPVEPSPSPVVPSPSPVPKIGTVFIANDATSLTMCYLLVGGTIDPSWCVRHTTAAGLQMYNIINVAVLGNRVWFTSANGPSRTYICTWSGLSLTSCITSNLDGVWGAAGTVSGNLVIDAANQRAYMADYWSSRVVSCSNITDMSGCTAQLTSSSTPVAAIYPNGLALDGSDLYIGAWGANRLVKCSVGAAGINVASCALIATTPPATTWGALSAVESSGGRFYFMTDTPSTVRVCSDATFSSCPSYDAGGLPLTGTANINSMDVLANIALLPTWNDPNDITSGGIIICTNAAAMSGCTLQLAGTGLVLRPSAVAVVP